MSPSRLSDQHLARTHHATLPEKAQHRQDSLKLVGYDEAYTAAWQQKLATAATCCTDHKPSEEAEDASTISSTANSSSTQPTPSLDYRHASARILRIASFEVAKPPYSWQGADTPEIEVVATLKDSSGRAVFEFAVSQP